MKTACLVGAPLLALLAQPAVAEPHRYELDPARTTVAFMVGHVGYADTLGIFGGVEGGFTYDMDTRTLSSLEVRVGTDSVDTFHDARDDHVRSADFLDVGAHPAMTFAAAGGEPSPATAGTVAGELTLLGQTRPPTLDVTLDEAEPYPFGHGRFTLGITAHGTVERSAFGMEYGVGTTGWSAARSR